MAQQLVLWVLWWHHASSCRWWWWWCGRCRCTLRGAAALGGREHVLQPCTRHSTAQMLVTPSKTCGPICLEPGELALCTETSGQLCLPGLGHPKGLHTYVRAAYYTGTHTRPEPCAPAAAPQWR